MKPASTVPSTMWTQIIEVIQQGDTAAAGRALEEFCKCYRPVIVTFFRQRGCKPEQAEDYAHEFFEGDILSRMDGRTSLIHRADRSRNGRFRYFLFQALRNFYGDKWRASQTKKAGGDVPHVPVEEQELPEGGDAAQRMERRFDRTLALEIIQRAARRSTHSEQMLAHLRRDISQKEAAEQLDISEEAFKQAFHRFRQRFPRDLRDEVAKLVGPDKETLEDEIRYLMLLFSEADT